MPTSDSWFNVGDPEVREEWEKEVNYQAINRRTFTNPKYGLIGDNPDKAIVNKNSLFQQGGTRATINLLRNFTGPLTGSNATLRGNEEEAETETFRFEIGLSRHAVKVNGEIVEQRVPWYTLRNLAINHSKYWAEVEEAGAVMHLTGFNIDGTASPGQHYLRGDKLEHTFWNAPQTPDALHHIRVGGVATDQDVGADSSLYLDRETIEQCKDLAKTLPIKIEPVRWNGADVYFLGIHSYVRSRLRQQDTEYYNLLVSAMQGGKIEGNPIWSGACGMVDDVIIFECPFMPPGINSVTGAIDTNTRRSVFFGAQALVSGQGFNYKGQRPYKTTNESWDYGDKVGASIRTMRGFASPYFNWYEDSANHDFAKIVITSYAANAYSL